MKDNFKKKQYNWIQLKGVYRLLFYFDTEFRLYDLNQNAFIIFGQLDRSFDVEQIINFAVSKIKITREEIVKFIDLLKLFDLIDCHKKGDVNVELRGEIELMVKPMISKTAYINNDKPFYLNKKLNRLLCQSSVPFKRMYFPSFAYIVLGNNCNLRCKHCYIPTREEGKSLENSSENIFKIIKELAQANVRKVSFIGGEPFLDSKLMDYIKCAHDEGISTGINTNGTLAIPSAQVLKNTHTQLKISVDGASDKIHDSIRGQGTFDTTIATIKNAIKCGIPVKVTFTVNRYNYKSLFQTYLLMNKIGVSHFYFQPYHSLGRGSGNEDVLSLKRLHFMYMKNVKKIILIVHFFSRSKLLLDMEVNCSARYTVTINAEGDLSFCPHFSGEYLLGNIFKKNLTQIWNSSKYENLHDQDKVEGLCKGCLFGFRCRTKYICRAERYFSCNAFFGGREKCIRGSLSRALIKCFLLER